MRHPFLAATLIPALFAACSSTPVAPPAAPVQAAAPAVAAAPAQPAQSTVTPVTAPTDAMSHLDPNSPLSREHSVYFAFDEAVLPSESKPVIERHGDYLSQHAPLKVVVQGNSDERGSSEYNLALGQRRAEAVKKALELVGAKAAQIEATSFGEEKPQATGHDEAAWRQNRRADIVYLKER